MKLNELPKLAAYSKKTKRRGKGVGSGQGKTAGRGHKGGKARAGYSPAPCCSGIPFYRHLPIRGFSNFRFETKNEIVSLERLIILNIDVVDKKAMYEAGLIKKIDSLVKVLCSKKEVSRPMTVIANSFSKSAIEAIEKAGGKSVSLLSVSQEN